MTSYHDYISGLAKLVADARRLPVGTATPLLHPKRAPDAPTALIFSPHPDDEVIVGGLPFRLLREANWNVLNVAVTLGSNKARQAGRLAELRACCDHIGFGLVQTRENGLDAITPRARNTDPAEWERSVERIVEILREHRPRAIFFPHDDDWNSTHVGTHLLVMDALRKLGADFGCFAAETEFWGAMDAPNLMVEISEDDLAELITALSFHVGEVRRNPYHLFMPGWLMDNVRRGGELVGGQGGAAPEFLFGSIYRLRRWTGREFEPLWAGGRFLKANENPARLFEP